MTHSSRPVTACKIILAISAVYFLYVFTQDSRAELFSNPVHFFDDAYMFIRYAKIWHMGHGEAWNMGEGPVYGNTSQLHFLFVLLLTSIPGIPDDTVIKVSSWIPSLLFMVWLPWFAARHSTLFASHRAVVRTVLWTGILCPLLYWNSPYAYHWLTGMDTALSAFLNLLVIDSVLCLARQPGRARLLVVVVIIYLSFLARPENILAGSLFTILYLGWLQRCVRETVIIGVAVASLLVVDALAKYMYFGDIVPLAFYAKHSGFLQGYAGAGFAHPVLYLFVFLIATWPFLGSAFVVLRRQTMPVLLVLIMPVAVTIAYFFTVTAMMGFQARYYFPFIGYPAAAAIILVDRQALSVLRSWRIVPAIFFMLSGFWFLHFADRHRADMVHAMLGKLETCDDHLKDPGQLNGSDWYHVDTDGFQHLVNILQQAPAGVTAAMTEHGFIGAKIPQVTILDMTGLHNPDIAHHGFSAGRLLARAPDVIWLPHWHYTCMNQQLLSDKVFQDSYDFYPGLFTWGIALRRNSPYYPELARLLDDQVRQMYPGYTRSDFLKTSYK